MAELRWFLAVLASTKSLAQPLLDLQSARFRGVIPSRSLTPRLLRSGLENIKSKEYLAKCNSFIAYNNEMTKELHTNLTKCM